MSGRIGSGEVENRLLHPEEWLSGADNSGVGDALVGGMTYELPLQMQPTDVLCGGNDRGNVMSFPEMTSTVLNFGEFGFAMFGILAVVFSIGIYAISMARSSSGGNAGKSIAGGGILALVVAGLVWAAPDIAGTFIDGGESCFAVITSPALGDAAMTVLPALA